MSHVRFVWLVGFTHQLIASGLSFVVSGATAVPLNCRLFLLAGSDGAASLEKLTPSSVVG